MQRGSLLKIENFSLSFHADEEAGGKSEVLRDINLTIEAGTTHALVGESGSGKSVTAMSVLRLLEDVASVQTSGSISFQGRNILELDKKSIRKIRGNAIAMIFQEPMTSLNPVYTIGSQLMEPLILHRKLSRDQAGKEVVRLLTRTGITDPEYRINSYPYQLSGGQRQRVMIAMALACRPALLIADEPTTALDVTIQAQILELLRDIQEEFQMAVLLITHDLPMVRQAADTVSIMHQGRIIEQNSCEALFTAPKHEYTRQLLNAVPHTRHTPASNSTPLVQMKGITCEFRLKKAGSGWFKVLNFLNKRSKKSSEQESDKSLVRAVDNVDLTIQQGTTLGIIGESGSGKSTLALCLLKLNTFQGTVTYYGGQEQGFNEKIILSQLSNRLMRPLRKELQIVFQDPFSSLSPRMTVGQIISEGLRVHRSGHNRRQQQQLVFKALEEVELEPEMADRFPHEFSGGQRQRIAIARAIILKPKLLILDEPTSALDTTIQAQIIDLLKQLQQRHTMTYIFITHDLRVIRSLADRLVVMRQGKIVESGPADRVFAKPAHTYTRNLFQAAFYN